MKQVKITDRCGDTLYTEPSSYYDNEFFIKIDQPGVFVNRENAKELRRYLNEFLGEEKENHALYESLCRENLNLRKQLTESYEKKLRGCIPEIVYLVNKYDISKETNAKLDKLEKELKDAEELRIKNEAILDRLRKENQDYVIYANNMACKNLNLKKERDELLKYKQTDENIKDAMRDQNKALLAEVEQLKRFKTKVICNHHEGDIGIKLFKIINNIK